jgi:hypothetical protein
VPRTNSGGSIRNWQYTTCKEDARKLFPISDEDEENTKQKDNKRRRESRARRRHVYLISYVRLCPESIWNTNSNKRIDTEKLQSVRTQSSKTNKQTWQWNPNQQQTVLGNKQVKKELERKNKLELANTQTTHVCREQREICIFFPVPACLSYLSDLALLR